VILLAAAPLLDVDQATSAETLGPLAFFTGLGLSQWVTSLNFGGIPYLILLMEDIGLTS